MDTRRHLHDAAGDEVDRPLGEAPADAEVASFPLVDVAPLAERLLDLRLGHPKLDLADADAGIDRRLASRGGRRER
jgi:hypothetical protein